MNTKGIAVAPSSDRMKTTLVKSIYPWRTLKVHESFGIPQGKVNAATMRSLAYKTGKRLGRRFKVVDYGEGGIEVGRLPDRTVEAEKPKTWVDKE